MKFYYVTDGAVDGYFGTFTEAHTEAKKLDRFGVVIFEAEVPTDKPNVLRMLTGKQIIKQHLRAWNLTPRGGAKSIDNAK